MAHKTLISGTAYSVTGGRDLIGGTGYAKKKGRVLVNGAGYDIPFSSGIPLSTVALGDILMLNENGSPVPFYVCKHDYESGLNGAGRTLLVRKDCSDNKAFNKSGYNRYAGGEMDTWLNDTWIKLLDTNVQSGMSETKFYYTPLAGNSVTSLQRAVFLLSWAELGKSPPNTNAEGTALDADVIKKLKPAYKNGKTVTNWTRTPDRSNRQYAYAMDSYNGGYVKYGISFSYASRPAFTLPGTFPVIQNSDGTYSPAV